VDKYRYSCSRSHTAAQLATEQHQHKKTSQFNEVVHWLLKPGHHRSFAGSGTTGVAAVQIVLVQAIERDPAFQMPEASSKPTHGQTAIRTWARRSIQGFGMSAAKIRPG
jgi:hypothetical protein